jgi:spore coat protein U domain-containing protein, fimbrial subunit CupE1/2/3/6
MKGRGLDRFALLLGAVVMAGGPSVAWAKGNCSFVTVTGVAFGTYNVFDAADLDSMGTVSFQCNPGAAGSTVLVTLSAGSSGSFTQRHLLSGTDQLGYNLYLDPARTEIWGDGTGGSSPFTVTLPASGWTTITQPVYGRIAARQDVGSGTYVDTITVTMNW